LENDIAEVTIKKNCGVRYEKFKQQFQGAVQSLIYCTEKIEISTENAYNSSEIGGRATCKCYEREYFQYTNIINMHVTLHTASSKIQYGSIFNRLYMLTYTS